MRGISMPATCLAKSATLPSSPLRGSLHGTSTRPCLRPLQRAAVRAVLCGVPGALRNRQMLADAREFWRTARANGDVAGEAVWLDALNVLLDRM